LNTLVIITPELYLKASILPASLSAASSAGSSSLIDTIDYNRFKVEVLNKVTVN
jgi:hypothetical protein